MPGTLNRAASSTIQADMNAPVRSPMIGISPISGSMPTRWPVPGTVMRLSSRFAIAPIRRSAAWTRAVRPVSMGRA